MDSQKEDSTRLEQNLGNEDGHCVMYDECDDSPFTPGTKLTCVYNGPPKKLDEDAVGKLQKMCPELVEKYGSTLCCSPTQVETLKSNMDLPKSFISRCPNCFYNFRQIFCELACSPKQSTFLNVTKSINSTVHQGKVLELILCDSK